MKFKTDFLAEDYSTLCWFQAKRASIIVSLLVAAAFALTLAGLSQVTVVGIVAFAILFPIIYRMQKKNVIKKADRRFGAFGASSELELTVNDSEILQISNSGETRLPWEDVYSVCESDESYYVFLTKNKAFYFPKRSFDSKDQESEFLDYIKKYVPEKKVKLK